MTNHQGRHRHAPGIQPVSPTRRRRTYRWIAVLAVTTAIAASTLYGVHQLIGAAHPDAAPLAPAPSSQSPATTPLPISPPAPTTTELAPDVAASFANLEQRTDAVIGVALTPLGGGPVTHLGQWYSGPAWSTSKVPLVLAALRSQAEPTISSTMTAAIETSDNDSAEALWAALGDPTIAAHRVEEVLRDSGDHTTVQSQRIRSGFSAFGQTIWSLDDQASFLSHAACDSRTRPVLQLMSHISAGQRWGLGTLDEAKFKGGWGPSPAGSYLVRQFGIVPTPHGDTVVAIAAEPSSGSFDAGTAALTSIASWLDAHLDDLPAGTCA